MVYLQIDGQPVDPSRWFQENHPCLKEALFRRRMGNPSQENIQNYQDDWRVYARSASDAKGPVVMFLNAVTALIEKILNPILISK